MSDLRFFDANCLVGRISRPGPGTLHSPEDILGELRRHGVQEALIAAAQAAERDTSANSKILDVVAQHPGTRPVWVMPQHTTIDIPDPDAFVAEILAAGVCGVRVAPSPYHGHLVAPWALGPAWSALASARMPVLLASSDLGRYPDGPSTGFSAQNVYDMCQAFPDLPMVIVRTNFSAVRVLVPLLRECPNLHAEMSFFTAHRGYEFLAKTVGADRLLFGSGMPVGPPGPSVLGTTFAKIPQADRALIAGDNLRRLINGIQR